MARPSDQFDGVVVQHGNAAFVRGDGSDRLDLFRTLRTTLGGGGHRE